MTAKAIKLGHHTLPPFESLNSGLSALFGKIKTAGVGGTPLKDPKGNTMPGTKEGAKAYGDAWKEAQKQVKAVIAKLSPDELTWAWTGLELSTTPDKHADDVTNSVLSTWDAAASKYMKNDTGGGDGEAGKLLPRLQEFDTAVSSKGGTPVKKDE